MDKNQFTPGLRKRLFESMTGRTGDVSGAAGGSLTDKLQAAFGPGKRGAPVNVKAAADALGVTPRTVQRWISGQIRTPKADHSKALTRMARQAATTKAGRKAAMASRRGDRASRFGATVRIQGTQGPMDYERPKRWANLDLSGSDIDAMRTAYEEGGDKGLMSWTQGWLDQNYVEDWNIQTLDDWDIRSK